MAALGWDAGSLAPGRLADFVNIRMDGVADGRVRTRPWWQGVIFAATAADIHTVVVGGRAGRGGGPTPARPRRSPSSWTKPSGRWWRDLAALTGIGTLVTCDEAPGGGRWGWSSTAALVCDGGRVVYAGPEAAAPSGTDEQVDAGGRCVLPGFVDSHTHLIFAGDRAAEFAARMAGADYHPGGILDTVAATRSASAEELERSARRLVGLALSSGTTTVEIKTGYGLDARSRGQPHCHRPALDGGGDPAGSPSGPGRVRGRPGRLSSARAATS